MTDEPRIIVPETEEIKEETEGQLEVWPEDQAETKEHLRKVTP